MKQQKIVIVSHCVLNTSAKVYNLLDTVENELKICQDILRYIIQNEIQILQLPCPEFSIYGSRRWGHVMEQFDNVFYRDMCRDMLVPIVKQIREYLSWPERFKVLGVIGINGSPSCGVNYTCSSLEWYGEFSANTLETSINTIKSIPQKGVFMDVLASLMMDNEIDIPFSAIDIKNTQDIYNLLDS